MKKLQSTTYERNIYLQQKTLEEVEGILEKQFYQTLSPQLEKVSVHEAYGRITATSIYAKVSAPYYNAAAMDGICVTYQRAKLADDMHPIRLTKGIDFQEIDTGDCIEEPYDAVIMIEDVEWIDQNTVEIRKAVSPWQHIRPAGEDIVAGELIVPSKTEISPVILAAIVAGGWSELYVYKKPSVGILPTGTEIISEPRLLQSGKILDSNSFMIKGLIEEYGGRGVTHPPHPDIRLELLESIDKMIDDHDMLLICAGSSAGREDYTKSILEELGTVYTHGITIKPGKPVIIAKVKGKPVFGIPGYPVSAYVIMDQIVKKLVRFYIGKQREQERKIEAVLTTTLTSSLKHEEFVRVKIGKVHDCYIATPLKRGAGITMSLVRADGIMRVPKEMEGIEAGEEVKINLLSSLSQIDQTLVVIGSHDILIDVMNDVMHETGKTTRISSTHVGSLSGLIALRRSQCHIAPTHLLDEETGNYNLNQVGQLFPEREMVLVKGVKRLQGLYVPKGNPKGITGIGDLAREDITLVNRQKGAGTRVLLDYLLKRTGIDWNQINGYNRIMSTHTMVASAVKSGTADVGMGIYSVAKVLDLDFIPIDYEEYDFLVEKAFTTTTMYKDFIQTLESEMFRQRVIELGGYELYEIYSLKNCM